jgi:hypothetical protein
MNPELINMYIERLLNEIQEATKNRLLLETQLKFTEKINSDFLTKIKELETQIEKQSKKTSRKSDPESDVF